MYLLRPRVTLNHSTLGEYIINYLTVFISLFLPGGSFQLFIGLN
jgi:hypothetical protein